MCQAIEDYASELEIKLSLLLRRRPEISDRQEPQGLGRFSQRHDPYRVMG
jgi:hypothetical protein